MAIINTLPPSQTLASPQQDAGRRFDGISWLTLALTLSLILFSISQKIYRLTLPTDGWSFTTGEIGSVDQDRPTYTRNLLGLPSPLQPGDRLLAVEGQSFEVIYNRAKSDQIQPLPTWRAGQTMRYTVERQGRAVDLNVPLYAWQVRPLLRELLTDLTLPASALLAAVGWFVFLKRPREASAQALLLFSICLLVANVSSTVIDWSLPEMLTPVILSIAIFFSNWIFATVMFPSLLLLTLIFPRPKRFVQQHPRPLIALLYGLVPLLIAGLGPIPTIGWVAVLGLTLLSLAALVHSFFTGRDPVGRAQMRWAVGGLVVMVLGFIPMNLSGLGWWPLPFPPQLEAIWFPTMLFVAALGFGVAILRYRLFDIDLLINRALVYGTLTASVIGLYVFVVGYLSALFRVESHLFISLAATGVVAVLFQPLRQWLQRGVNRLLYGRRDEPVAVLAQLGQRLEIANVPEALLTSLVETVTQALKLPYAAIALQEGAESVIKAELGQPAADTAQLPLVYQAITVGYLIVTPRRPGEPFNVADRLLLETIAHQAGAAVHAIKLTTDLQRSRQQLVTAREEERRRLRRDLHDGLGPHLASQTLTIEAIGKLMDRDPAAARELLHHLKIQAQSAITDIRRLVYELRPPALDELGLVEALSESARQYESAGWNVSIQARPAPLPPLPAAIEIAVYRIVREAITNATRHAQTCRCSVQIEVAGGRLDLLITDDGPGFPAGLHYGVGLTSMRERAEELGGQITLDNQSEGGARVRVWLPLPKEV